MHYRAKLNFHPGFFQGCGSIGGTLPVPLHQDVKFRFCIKLKNYFYFWLKPF